MEIKYFVFNRSTDWIINGYVSNLEFIDDKIMSLPKSKEGFYFSKALDSSVSEVDWHRIKMKYIKNTSVAFKLLVYASDDLSIKDDTNKKIDDYLVDKNISNEEKIQFLDYIGAKTFEDPKDVLFVDIKGRYLWFAIEIVNYSNEKTLLEEMVIEFPKVNFVSFLPEIYQNDMSGTFFIERFIGIYQNLYSDLTDKIRSIPTLFDPMVTDSDFIPWLTECLSFKDTLIWKEDKLRVLLDNIIDLYAKKGTKDVISKLVELYADTKPFIIEKYQIENLGYYLNNKKEMDNLYGNNIYFFTVIIKEGYIKDSESYVGLLKVINRFKPIDLICNLVVLNCDMHLGHHCYLGINSRIAECSNIKLSDNYVLAESKYLDRKEDCYGK